MSLFFHFGIDKMGMILKYFTRFWDNWTIHVKAHTATTQEALKYNYRGYYLTLSISTFQLLGLESLETCSPSEGEWRSTAVFPLLLLKEEMNTLRSSRLISFPVLETILFLLLPKARTLSYIKLGSNLWSPPSKRLACSLTTLQPPF